jgi:hypothetical protein
MGEEHGQSGCPRCEEFEREVEELRREVSALRAQNAELLRVAAERDFERPPHYQ